MGSTGGKRASFGWNGYHENVLLETLFRKLEPYLNYDIKEFSRSY